jgi:hypothetical protein
VTTREVKITGKEAWITGTSSLFKADRRFDPTKKFTLTKKKRNQEKNTELISNIDIYLFIC